jgi:multimeric flavodoxin WrbA
MEKIVGIIGSPRKLGNSELMVKEISRNIPVEHELVLLNLSLLKLGVCTGCYQCLFKEGACYLEDDMELVMKNMMEASGVILAAPTYFLGPNSSFKILVDRALMFWARLEKFYGKPAVVVALAAQEGEDGFTQLALVSGISALGLHVKDKAVVYAALPGEVFLNSKNKDIAAHLGKVLLQPNYVRVPKAYECPLCSGNCFKFIGGDRVECLTCHNHGKIRGEEGRPYMAIEKDPQNALGDLEARLAHRAWLMGMKEKFNEKKKILKEVSAQYLNDGQWIHKEGRKM